VISEPYAFVNHVDKGTSIFKSMVLFLYLACFIDGYVIFEVESLKIAANAIPASAGMV
jgi:hypothetical protein